MLMELITGQKLWTYHFVPNQVLFQFQQLNNRYTHANMSSIHVYFRHHSVSSAAHAMSLQGHKLFTESDGSHISIITKNY